MKVKLIERNADSQRAAEIAINQSEYLIGRGADCDLRLNDTAISRHHCTIRVTADGATLVDLGSANGTYRNGQRVRSQAPLRSGDEITLGSYRFVIDLGDRDWVELGKGPDPDAQSPTLKLKDYPSKGGGGKK